MKNHTWHAQNKKQSQKTDSQPKKDRESKIAWEVKANPEKIRNYVAARTKTRQGISELEIPNTTDDQENLTRTKPDKEKVDILSDTFSGVFTKDDKGYTYPAKA